MVQRQAVKTEEEKIGEQAAEGLFADTGLNNDACGVVLQFFSISEAEKFTPKLSLILKHTLWRYLFAHHFPHRKPELLEDETDYQKEYYHAEDVEYKRDNRNSLGWCAADKARIFRLVKGEDLEDFKKEWPIKTSKLYTLYTRSYCMRDNHQKTLFYWAKQCGRESLLAYVYELALNNELPGKSTLLHWAAMTHQSEKIQHLVGAGFRLDSKDKDQDTPGYLAVRNGHLSLISKMELPVDEDMVMIGVQYDLNLFEQFTTPEVIAKTLAKYPHTLCNAAEAGQTTNVQLLLKAKAAIEEKYNIGDEVTSLSIAAARGHVDTVQALLEAKAIVDTECTSGTALQRAAQHGHAKIARLLINAEAKLETADGGTPLMRAATEGRNDVVGLLLEAKANLEAKNNRQETALHLAVKHPQTLQLLLNNRANIQAETNNRNTPLHFAATKRENSESVRCLLQAKANIDKSNSSGETPLLLAIHFNNPDTAKLLLKEEVMTHKTCLLLNKSKIVLNKGSWYMDDMRYNILIYLEQFVRETTLPEDARAADHPLKKLQSYIISRHQQPHYNYTISFWGRTLYEFGFNKCEKQNAAFTLFMHIMEKKPFADLGGIHPALGQGNLGKIYQECLELYRPMAAAPARHSPGAQ